MAQFKKLFEPIKIGNLDLENRIYMLGLEMGYTPDFYVNERYKAFYRERAQGGAGLITIGIAFPSNMSNCPRGAGITESIGIWNDSFIKGLREVADMVRGYGPKTICQLGLQYHWQKSADAPGEMVGPSAVSTRRGAEPRELTVAEIQQIVEEFGSATKRAREAGFDAVEYHCGIGYFLNRFLSPLSNRRSDKYGGSLEKRMRFLLEIIDNARKKAGTDFTYFCRISAEEFMPGGNTLEESKQIAVHLEKAGIHCINVQMGWHEASRPMLHNFVPAGAFAYASEAIKKTVNIPVAIGYRINDPVVAERILVEGKADLIAMARALIADPHLPRKAKEGRPDDIRPCITCGYCLDTLMTDNPMACAVNARAGNEMEYRIEPATESRRVLVIGGGPAGMEAATIAAERGHKVTLLDENKAPGGQLPVAATVSYKGDIARYARYLTRRLYSAGVDVRCGVTANSALIVKLAPRVIVLACGATPLIPDIPGIDRPNVTTAIQVLKGEKKVGASVLIVGSGLVGCETAEFLLEQGKKVTILEMLPRLGADIGVTTRPFLLARLRQAGAVMEANARVVEITGRGVKARRDNDEMSFEADSIVLATGMRPRRELLEELKGCTYELHTIGDCLEPRRIAEAVAEAARIAYRL